MMKRKTKIGLAAVGSVLLLAILFAHSREHVDVPYRAMPEEVTIASDHTDLRGRWRDMVMIPAVSNYLASCRVDAVELRDEIGWRLLIPLTTGKNTVFALNPFRGDNQETVLYGASFAGWRRVVLQFMLATRWIPGLGRLDVAPEGSRYLQLGSKRHPSKLKVSFAMRDNVLLAALSEDGDAVRDLEMKLDANGSMPKIFGSATPYDGAGKHLHRFWLKAPEFVGDDVAPVRFNIDRLDADGFAVSGDFPSGGLAEYIDDADELTGRNSKAALMASNEASFLALLPRKAAAKYLNGLFYGEGVAPEHKLQSEEDAVIYFNSAPYGGTFFGIPVPAVTILCPGVVISRDHVAKAVGHFSQGAKYPQVGEGENDQNRMLVPIRWQKGNALIKMVPSEFGVVELNRINHGFTFCSARRSYDSQLARVDKTDSGWHDWISGHVGKKSDDRAVAFLWLCLEPLSNMTKQTFSLFRIAQTFGLLKLEPDESRSMYSWSRFLDSAAMSGHIAVLVTVPQGGDGSVLCARIEFVR